MIFLLSCTECKFETLFSVKDGEFISKSWTPEFPKKYSILWVLSLGLSRLTTCGWKGFEAASHTPVIRGRASIIRAKNLLNPFLLLKKYIASIKTLHSFFAAPC
jgi:hypothetical protein